LNYWKSFTNAETRVLVAADSEDCVILGCTILIESQSVTDTQTDRQTPLRQGFCTAGYADVL